MNCKATKIDFDNAADEIYKFSKEVFAGNDEKKKSHLLESIKYLMNPNSSLKRPLEDVDIDSEAKRIKLMAPKVPNEIWMKIMSYLKTRDMFGKFALVNKHFHGLTLDPSAVKYLHIAEVRNKTRSKVLFKKWMKIVKRSRTLKELKIKAHFTYLDLTPISEKTIEALICSIPSLISIHLDLRVTSEITPDFIYKMLIDKSVIIVRLTAFRTDQTVENFLKKKGSAVLEKYRIMKNDSENWISEKLEDGFLF